MIDINKIKEGDRVQYVGSTAIGKCVGTVMKVYLPDELDDPDYPGSVELWPDVFPLQWPYKDCNTFAPWVDKLERV